MTLEKNVELVDKAKDFEKKFLENMLDEENNIIDYSLYLKVLEGKKLLFNLHYDKEKGLVDKVNNFYKDLIILYKNIM